MTILACKYIGPSSLTHGANACRLNGKTTQCLGFFSRCSCPELRHVRDRWDPAEAADRLGVRR